MKRQYVTANLSKETLRSLTLLREAWDLPSIDAVVQRLIQPHAMEKLKALGMQAPVDAVGTKEQ